MNTKEYEDEVMRTAGMPSEPMSIRQLLVMPVLGMCGESGEVAEIVKKANYHGHGMDYQHFAEELGDVLWYLTLAAVESGYSLSDLMQMNVDKLRKRYPEGFSEERSKNRDA